MWGRWLERRSYPLMSAIRRWDRAAADRFGHFVGISQAVGGRIKKAYGRDARIIFPPVEVPREEPSAEVDDYYLVVSRLAPYKRIDLAVQACTELNLPLVVIGAGRDIERLKSLAGPTIKFLGFIADDTVVRQYYRRCRAFIFPGEEDFGITPLEARLLAVR